MTLRASWWVGCLLVGASRELESRREIETEGEICICSKFFSYLPVVIQRHPMMHALFQLPR